MKRFNIFENVHFSEDKEIEEIIFENQNIKAIRIVSLNQKTDFMKEENLELVLVARGKAKLLINDEIINLKEGDFLEIPAHTSHKINEQENVIWYCIFSKK